MTPGIQLVPCPKGHLSSETDYCSECGGKIGGSNEAQAKDASLAGAGTADICPDCGTLREQSDIAFCEICGYNFVTGAHGELALIEEPALEAATAQEAPAESVVSATDHSPTFSNWRLVIVAGSQAGADEDSNGSAPVAGFVALNKPMLLIGRRDDALGIVPEIDLTSDEAVSRRHALVTLHETQQVTLRDIGAANGTRLNGAELEPMVDYPLHDGDEISLGHGSKLRLEQMG